MSTLIEIQDWLNGLVSRPGFVRAHPGFVHVLARLRPVLDPRVDVMAVSPSQRGFRLHVNRDFFRDQESFLPGVLQHELHHLVLGHVTEAKYRYAEHPQLMQLAMEASANEYIQHPLPGEPVTWQRFAEQGLRAGQSTLERYALLVTAWEQGVPLQVGLRFVDDHLGEGVGRSIPLPPHMVERMRRRRSAPGGDAGDTIRRLTDPAALADPPDWRRSLAEFAGVLRTSTASWLRPNRRFPEAIGIVPGRTRQATERDRPHVLAAIDTSRSMSVRILATIGRELARVARHARITVVECDKIIQRVYAFDGALHAVKGRGGTDLRPPFAAAFLARHQVDGVVYFTDGEGPYPEQAPAVQTLWVLIGNEPFPCPWGRQVQMEALP